MLIQENEGSLPGPKAIRGMVVLAVAGALLSGCVIDAPPPGGAGGGGAVARPGFADGSWGDASGVATATLTNGSFVSVANDTGNRVAEGSYVYTGTNSLSLNYYSLLRQTTIRANCLLANQTTLNCTNDTGQQFQLFRRSLV